MHWLLALDTRLFHFINLTLQNSFCDVLMPFASGNAFFFPAIIGIGLLLLWKGGTRGRLYVLLLALILPLGDSLICSTLKELIGRNRPPLVLSDVHELLGIGFSKSMPSSHAANWAAATMITFIFYRRSLWFMVPLAALVGFSRVYNGVHFPSDVLTGYIVGAGYGFAGVWALNALWRWAGQKWFPLWWQKQPALVPLSAPPAAASLPADTAALRERQWLRLGYATLIILLLGRLAYLAAGVIDLSEDEAYYWVWSKHLALSYYSKPLLIAVTHWLGTHLWGDTAFGVRFFSPVIATILGFITLRFMSRHIGARPALLLLLAVNVTPLFAVGATLMTIDPLSVLFWTAAMIAGWRAIQDDARTRDWFWVGLWMGLGFLSKYTALLQLLCWVVCFALWPPARKQLRRAGPWVALLVNVLCMLPVLIWNEQHHWITVFHVAGDARIGEKWHPTLNFLNDFMFQELVLLNPVFYIAMLWAGIAFWRRHRHSPLPIYLFSMGAPLFLVYFCWTFHSRVLPNWIAPAVLPLFCLAAVYWHDRWRHGTRAFKRWLAVGVGLGLLVVIPLHDTDLIHQATGHSLPAQADPLGRVRAWDETAAVVSAARKQLLAEGPEVFVIGGHYGITSQLAFHLPKTESGLPDHSNVYCLTTEHPENQYYFWPGYAARHGQNALYVTVLGNPRRSPAELLHDFISDQSNTNPPAALPSPEVLTQQFASVTSLGVQPVQYRGRILRWVQLFACRDLK